MLPSDGPSLLKYGTDLVALKEFALAEKAFRKHLEKEPTNFEANVNLTGCLNAQGRQAKKH